MSNEYYYVVWFLVGVVSGIFFTFVIFMIEIRWLMREIRGMILDKELADAVGSQDG